MNNDIDVNFKYYAFISYSALDIKWGKHLQRKLENYRMPSTLCSERGWQRTPIKPVFFAPSDIQPGGLTAELQERLRSSRNLIVICSPNSAQSEWVGKEIEFFHSIGRTKDIHFFIVDGQPNSGDPETECFNPVLKDLGLPEILGANIHERIYSLPWLNKERAYVQLISKLLGIEFDNIWKRHRRLLAQKITAWVLGIILVLSTLLYTYMYNKPVDVNFNLKESSVMNDNLPKLKDAIVVLKLGDEEKTDTIHSITETLSFGNIPHNFIGKNVVLTFRCDDFISIDTNMILSKNMTLNVYRNPDVYGNIKFKIWNYKTESAVSDADVTIEGIKVVADNDAVYSLYVPLKDQKVKYRVKSSLTLLNDTIYMPCGRNVYLHVK